MAVEPAKQFWSPPYIYEAAATVADVRRSIRRASAVWLCTADGKHLKIAKAAVLNSLKHWGNDNPLSAKLFIAGELDGSVWIG